MKMDSIVLFIWHNDMQQIFLYIQNSIFYSKNKTSSSNWHLLISFHLLNNNYSTYTKKKCYYILMWQHIQKDMYLHIHIPWAKWSKQKYYLKFVFLQTCRDEWGRLVLLFLLVNGVSNMRNYSSSCFMKPLIFHLQIKYKIISYMKNLYKKINK